MANHKAGVYPFERWSTVVEEHTSSEWNRSKRVKDIDVELNEMCLVITVDAF